MNQWKPYWNGADVVMQSMSRYGFYGGIGHHSTIGMGQARLILNPELASVIQENSIAKRVRQ